MVIDWFTDLRIVHPARRISFHTTEIEVIMVIANLDRQGVVTHAMVMIVTDQVCAPGVITAIGIRTSE
jgi:hypothetical protein